MAIILPDLPYAYDALEPYIDAETMHLHHDKHHQTYVNNANAALEKHPEIGEDLEALLADVESIPADIRQATYQQRWRTLEPRSFLGIDDS